MIPIPHASRSCKILDAFAILCILQKKHEVIAVAVKHDATRRTIKFMIASDADVPSETKKHFRDMWKMMRRLAQRYRESVNPGPEDISPSSPIQDAGFQELDREFCHVSASCGRGCRVKSTGNLRSSWKSLKVAPTSMKNTLSPKRQRRSRGSNRFSLGRRKASMARMARNSASLPGKRGNDSFTWL